MEYLVTMTTHVPEGTTEQAVDDVRAREAARSRARARGAGAPAAAVATAAVPAPERPGGPRMSGEILHVDGGQTAGH